ncbi:cobaltochelatase subunit CobS, partial [Gammaproteobacteria bacterium]|nr:cobaltochelatase subunit CobS [Gammaproteobacteria bacterium]
MKDSDKIALPDSPDQRINVKKVFGIDSAISVQGFKEKTQWVPE